MHELAICTSLLVQVLRVAAAENSRQVGKVTLCIGPLCGVEPDQLRLAFPLVAFGTPCEGAQLDIEWSPVRVRCRSCDEESEALPNRLLCGCCGEWRVDLISGDEMLLLRVDLMSPAAARERNTADV